MVPFATLFCILSIVQPLGKKSSAVPVRFFFLVTHSGFIWFYNVVPSQVAQTVKNTRAMWETQVQSLGWEDPLEKRMATHSGILAWRNP